MEKNNPKYKNIGIHVIASIFTVEKGITKVLLIKRSKEPFLGMWSLIGGALYNDEKVEEALTREIYEKTGLKDVSLVFNSFFDEVDRSPVQRMVALSYLGVIDSKRVKISKETLETLDADWFALDQIPTLAYDHNYILNDSLKFLQKQVQKTNILRALFPDGFTMPEIQKIYEAILQKQFDRRNFRKKMLNLGLIKDTNKYINFEGKRPAKLYKFDGRKADKDVF